jgi:hypothetical protein
MFRRHCLLSVVEVVSIILGGGLSILLQEEEVPTHSIHKLSQLETSAHCFSRIYY